MVGARATRSEAQGGGDGGGERGSDSEHVWELELIGSADGPDVGCERGEWRWNQGFSSEYLNMEVVISWDLNPITQDI